MTSREGGAEDLAPQTRREVLVAREAFVDGVLHERAQLYSSDGGPLVAVAAHLYPLPKVTRPRVVKDNLGTRWRIVDGYVEWEARDGLWKRHSQSVEFLQNLATLLTSPTEEVDAEE